jgi:hypothetical protein
VPGATVKTDSEYGYPVQVGNDDIIYGIDGTIGKPGGLELVTSVFLMFGLALGQVATLDWSYDSGIAVVMHFKTST